MPASRTAVKKLTAKQAKKEARMMLMANNRGTPIFSKEEVDRAYMRAICLAVEEEQERMEFLSQGAVVLACEIARAEEREACAKLVESKIDWTGAPLVEAIRARGRK